MRELLNVEDLVEIAVEDEASGVAFYSAMAQRTSEAELKAVFARLAEEEGHHQQRFQDIRRRMGPPATREEWAGQYQTYLQTLTSGRAFPDPQSAIDRARSCRGDLAALDLADRFERDTLMLMNELRGMLPAQDQAVVAKLVEEEQGHLVALAEARRKLR